MLAVVYRQTGVWMIEGSYDEQADAHRAAQDLVALGFGGVNVLPQRADGSVDLSMLIRLTPTGARG